MSLDKKRKNVANDDFFDYSDTTFVKATTESELYKPSYKDGNAGVYESVIRFVPFWKDKKKSLITKYVAYLEHPEKGKKAIDSYRSIGKDKECKIVQTFFELHNSESAKLKARKDMFKQPQENYAIVQILEDKQKPELVGKLKIFKFGKTLKDIYDLEEMPKKGTPKKPFDPFNGRAFHIYITEKKDFNDYSKCKFLDDGTSRDDYPFLVGGKSIYDVKDRGEIIEWLEQNSPDLLKYEFREWDEATKEYVDSVIAEVTGKRSNSKDLEDIRTSNKRKSIEIEDEEDDDDDDIVYTKKTVPKEDIEKEIKSSKTSKKQVVEEDDDDDEFDFDDDIDLE